MARWFATFVLIFSTSVADPAGAQAAGTFDEVSGLLDLRVAAADGADPSWLDGGHGRLRNGAGTHASIGEAVLIWHPRMNEALTAHLNVAYQPGVSPDVDVIEAYLRYRAMSVGDVTVSARLGSFFPAISLEHDDLFWSTVDTITPSAINTWITEEVRLNGLEATARMRTRHGTVSLTGAVFGAGDTAGTLLAFRGWALHDRKAGVFTEFALPPPTPGRRQSLQAPFTRPNDEIDDRAGFFGDLEWSRAGHKVALSHYDNAGSRIGLRDGQYAWETRFTQLAMRFVAPSGVEISAQGMIGQTQMGPSMPEVAFDADFSSAFLMVSRSFGAGRLTARGETFRVRDNSFRASDDQDEDGWAATVAWVHSLAPHLQARSELLHVASRRDGLPQIGVVATNQEETLAQLALRFAF